MYQPPFPALAGSALLRVLTSRGGIVRRFTGAFMLVTAVLIVAAAALTTALAGPAQAASGLGPARFGIRLVDVPVDEANNPRAFRYIIDHLNPGTTIHRRVQIANLSASAARIAVYPDAAVIPGLRRVPDLPGFTQYAVAGRYCAGCRHGHATSIM